MPESLSSPDYDIWYCPRYPVEGLGTGRVRPEFQEAYRKLVQDIALRGLINPLIVLNHRDPSEYKKAWVMTGRNRLNAIRDLGWDTVPAIVTGDRPDSAFAYPVLAEDLQKHFSDGEVYFGSQGPRLRNMTRFEKGEFPDARSG